MRTRWGLGVLAVSAVLLVGCESKRDRESGKGLAAIASGRSALQEAPPAGAPSAEPAVPAKQVVRRPQEASELLLTDERRGRIEHAFPQAVGFVTASSLEQQLFAKELKRGKDAEAVRIFDRLAKGKWILFTGNIASPEAEGFELAVRYTPRDPNDPLGVTSQYFPVRFRGIEGYDAAEYRPGELAAVLGKYDGDRQVIAGHDLVLLDRWYGGKAE